MNEPRLELSNNFEPSARLDERSRHDLAQAVAHPWRVALAPAANNALAVGLGVYSLAYLFAIFSVAFSR